MAKFHWFPLRFGDLSRIFPPKSRPGRTFLTRTGNSAPRTGNLSRTGNSAQLKPEISSGPEIPSDTSTKKQHDALHRFGHNFHIRTPFWVFFGSFRSYERHLQQQHGRSLIHWRQKSWASTKVSTIWLKIAGLRYKNFAILPPLAFLC